MYTYTSMPSVKLYKTMCKEIAEIVNTQADLLIYSTGVLRRPQEYFTYTTVGRGRFSNDISVFLDWCSQSHQSIQPTGQRHSKNTLHKWKKIHDVNNNIICAVRQDKIWLNLQPICYSSNNQRMYWYVQKRQSMYITEVITILHLLFIWMSKSALKHVM